MILNSNDLRNVRPIAENINDPARLEPYIREAETLRLVDAIGANLYRWLDETDFSRSFPIRGRNHYKRSVHCRHGRRVL